MFATTLRAAAAAAVLVCSAGAASADDLAFTLINKSSAGVSEFYVSHSGTNVWEESLIPDGKVLPSGSQIDVEIADGRRTCEYDIRSVFDDGTDHEEYGLDLCELGSYTYTDE